MSLPEYAPAHDVWPLPDLAALPDAPPEVEAAARDLFADRATPAATLPEVLPARLQVMPLPNGRFLLVLTSAGPDSDALVDRMGAELAQVSGAAAVLSFREPVDVVPDEDCSMVGRDDDLVSALRREFASFAAVAERDAAELAAWLQLARELLPHVPEDADGDTLRARLRALVEW